MKMNRAFSLHNLANPILVVSGGVDIFCIYLDEDKNWGKREYLFHIEEQKTIFPIRFAKEKVELLAVPLNDTSLKEIPHIVNRPDYGSIFSSWFIEFYSILYQALPEGYEEPLSNESLHIREGTVITSKEPLWIEVVQGNFSICGHFSCASDGMFVPLSKNVWLRATQDSQVYTYDAKQFVEMKVFHRLESFYSLLADFLVFRYQEKQDDQQRELRKRDFVDSKMFETAILRIGSFLEIEDEELNTPSEEDHFSWVCRIVAKENNIKINIPANWKETKDKNIQDLALVSHLRIREVTLRGNWWQEDHAAFVAFHATKQYPVALVPRDNKYYLYDSEKRQKLVIDAKVASELDSKAYIFHRRFEKSLNLKYILQFGVQTSQNDVLMIALAGILSGLLALAIPIFTGYILDSIIPSSEYEQLLQIVALLISLAFSSAIFNLSQGIAIVRLQNKMGPSVQIALIDHLLRLPLDFFRRYSAGDLAKRALGINAIYEILESAVISSLLGVIFGMLSLFLLVYYSVTLALIALFLLFLLFLTVITISYLQIQHHREIFLLGDKISGAVIQFILGISKIRVAGAEGRIFAVWAQKFLLKKRITMKAKNLQNILLVVNATFPLLTYGVIFAAIAYLQESNEDTIAPLLSTGSFVAFLSAFHIFSQSIVNLNQSLIALLQIIPLYERSLPILKEKPEVDWRKPNPGELSGSIDVSHVTFTYPHSESKMIHDVSLQITPGEFVGIVGSSGAGKSTLLRLLLGLENPQKGAIFYDDKNLKNVDMQALRRQIGVLLQNSKIMPGSIYRNIIDSYNLTLADAWHAAELAGLTEDIQQMPMGMHTNISENANTISGGQKQRLLIARALVLRPKIIFFDEATSALDENTQKIVAENVEKLNATRVVIAHRVSTIKKADTIYVMERGRIVQQGNYDSLTSKPGPFQELAKRQVL